jgi:hypothetical protein
LLLFCVDGVHGFGIENQDISQLGCDFFVAGTHKWIFGPRGTAVVWGFDLAWARSKPVIPSFSESYEVWLGGASLRYVQISIDNSSYRLGQTARSQNLLLASPIDGFSII